MTNEASERSRKTENEGWFSEHAKEITSMSYGLARRLGATHADAEDIAQETAINILGKIDTLRKDNYGSYVFKTAHNLFINLVRKRDSSLITNFHDSVHSRRDSNGGVIGDVFDNVEGRERSPAELASQTEEVNRAYQTFNTLPDHLRDPIILVDTSGMSYEKAATSLGIPVGTIKSRLHKGRRMVRERLGYQIN